MKRGRHRLVVEGSRCDRCERRLVSAMDWNAASPDARARMKAAGGAKAARANLCTACWAWLKAHDQLGAPVTREVREDAGHCDRCGLKGIRGLCRDCFDVTLDLGERDRWIDERMGA